MEEGLGLVTSFGDSVTSKHGSVCMWSTGPVGTVPRSTCTRDVSRARDNLSWPCVFLVPATWTMAKQ